MPLDPSVFNNGVMIFAGFGAAFLVVLWVSLIFWTYRDIRSRSRDPLLRILATLVSIILFLPGLIIYLILRPKKTLEEEYTRTLEEEALLQAVEENSACPGCNRRIQEDWVICPACHTRLKHACSTCGKSIHLSWDVCPYCATPVASADLDSVAAETSIEGTILPSDSYPSGII